MKDISFNLKNKNILITGGSGFLGSQIVNAFLKNESNVYSIDLTRPKKNNITKFFKSDVTKENQLKKVIDFFKKKRLPIDVLINNAAIDYKPNKLSKKKLKLENFSN